MLVTDMRAGDVIAVGQAAMMVMYRGGRPSLLIEAPREVRVTFARSMSEALAAAGWTRGERGWQDANGNDDVARLLAEAGRLLCART